MNTRPGPGYYYLPRKRFSIHLFIESFLDKVATTWDLATCLHTEGIVRGCIIQLLALSECLHLPKERETALCQSLDLESGDQN